MSEETAKYGKESKSTKKNEKPKKAKKVFKGVIVAPFKLNDVDFKRGSDYKTTDENTFNKLIRLLKIIKK